jgi:NarL family two-component system response regulator LiaR
VVLTNFANPENTQRAYLTGALAVLDKERIAPVDLLEAIRQALRGYVTLHYSHLGALMAPRSDSLLHLLTPTERTILEMVAEGKQSGEIAAETNTALNTVKSHYRNIRRKLNVRRTYDAAIKVGLVRAPPLDEDDNDSG